MIGSFFFLFFIWTNNLKKCSFFSYLQNVIEIYYIKLFISPFAWAFSITVSIFAALMVSFENSISLDKLKMINFFFIQLQKIGRLGTAIACYLEMMIVCYMGNNVIETVF